MLNTFKIVVITDRQELQDQLQQTMTLTGESIQVARDIPHARELLARPGSEISFIMIQKARGEDQEDQEDNGPTLPKKRLNLPSNILLIVDEAHRSHTKKLHSNVMYALPNSAKIGFTGTPIIMGERKHTEHIFGSFIDKYTILQSEEDGATLPILYEGYQAYMAIAGQQELDQSYTYLMEAIPEAVRLRVANQYPSEIQVLEAQELIEAKAHHILLHYVANILPGGFKALIVARSREATVRYQGALVRAKHHLIETLEQLDQSLLATSLEKRAALPLGIQMLLQAHPQLKLLQQLECAAVISSGEQDPAEWRTWSDEAKRKNYVARFKQPLIAEEGRGTDNLALLCVQQMLLTGFDAPTVQGLYLDRNLQAHNLLQATARVNRPYPEKTHGLVVDYYGVAGKLKEALIVYKAEGIQGAFFSIGDELNMLEARHLRVTALFAEQGIDISKINLSSDRETIDVCLNLLKEPRLRADFEEKLKKFLESMDVVLPRPEALPYVHDMQVLGYINKIAANFLPGEGINLKGTGKKISNLIDEHIAVLGIEQTVAPISISDADFAKKIDFHVSDETKASQMEHLARYYIRQRYEEDPEYYKRLSERLEAILESLKGQWAELVVELYAYTQELRRGRPSDPTGLDPHTQLPFLDILAAEASKGSPRFNIAPEEHLRKETPLTAAQRKELADFTVQLVEMIRQRVRRVDFWRRDQNTKNLKADIIHFLDDHDLISPPMRQDEVASRLVLLANTLRWLLI